MCIVGTSAEGVEGTVASIVFTLEWENSWQDDYNYDSGYISLRYKLLGQSPETWFPVYLSSSGHSTDNGFVRE